MSTSAPSDDGVPNPAVPEDVVSLPNNSVGAGRDFDGDSSVGSESVPTPGAQSDLPGQPYDSMKAGRPPESWLWLNTLDQKIVTIFAAGFLMLAGYHWATLGGWWVQPIEIERQPERTYDFRIDINSASWVEWTQIEGIGQVTAEKIVADRDSKGAFRSVQDLLRVKGIGPKILEKMRPFLREPNDATTPKKAAS